MLDLLSSPFAGDHPHPVRHSADQLSDHSSRPGRPGSEQMIANLEGLRSATSRISGSMQVKFASGGSLPRPLRGLNFRISSPRSRRIDGVRQTRHTNVSGLMIKGYTTSTFGDSYLPRPPGDRSDLERCRLYLAGPVGRRCFAHLSDSSIRWGIRKAVPATASTFDIWTSFADSLVAICHSRLSCWPFC